MEASHQAFFKTLSLLSITIIAVTAAAVVGADRFILVGMGCAGLALAWALYLLRRNGFAGEPASVPMDEEKAVADKDFCRPDLAAESAWVARGELAAAHDIQMRLVPHTFPPLPGCPAFDLYAAIQPAKEIGGDFYDFWMLGKEKLAMVMADVSGKGVPAALFMAMSRTYLRAFSRYLHDPAQLLERLNREVARHNPGNMFVTMFCCVVDLRSGEMEYANAGHNPPLRKSPGRPAAYFDLADNPPVGFLADLTFMKNTCQLAPGEALLMYTDGVTEAMDPSGAMLGEDAVRRMLSETADGAGCRALLMQMLGEVAEFVQDAEPYDDITIMAYRQSGLDAETEMDESGCEGEPDSGDAALTSFSLDAGSMASFAGGDNQFMSLTDFKSSR
ncbi:MAG: serine/threonine-protein phosphatase [Planctomycetaceae bacterium]|nr:serine/threonine-protein phosphatase [Planctomycetaceae bacterium]